MENKTDLNVATKIPDNEVNLTKPFLRKNAALTNQRQRTISTSSIVTEHFGSVVIVTTDRNDDVISQAPPPDGGWGWVVVTAALLAWTVQGFTFSGHNVLYVAVVEHFQADRGVAAWVSSMFSFTGNILGVVIGAFIKQYGSRTMGLVGALFGAIGHSLSYFLVNIPFLCFTVGVLGGMGSTLNFMSNSVIIQEYFDKKRTLAMGIATTGMSLGGFLAPPVVNALLNAYGLSGTYLIEGGIWLQMAVFSSLYRPLPQKRTKEIAERSKSLQIVTILKDSVNFSVMRNPQLVLFLVGTFLYNYGTMSFYGHYLSRMEFLGTERRLAIIFQTTMSVATAVSRIIFSFVGNIKGLDRPMLYAVGVMVGGLVVVSFPVAQSPIPLGVYGILNGLSAASYFTVQPSTLVEVAGMSQIAKVTGLFHAFLGFSILTSIPLTGYILDFSGSYDLPFYVVGSIHLSGAAILLALAILRRTRWKNSKPT